MAFLAAVPQGEQLSSLMPIVAVLMLIGGAAQLGGAYYLWLRRDWMKQASGPQRWRNLLIFYGAPWIVLLPAVVLLIIQAKRNH
jgi:hypothetical protein